MLLATTTAAKATERLDEEGWHDGCAGNISQHQVQLCQPKASNQQWIAV